MGLEQEEDLYGKLLAQGISWEVLGQRTGEPERIKKLVMASCVAYPWLVGRVGGGVELFDQHRGQIVAVAKLQRDWAKYANIPHPINHYYDPESPDKGPLGLGKEVKPDLELAKSGLWDLGFNLAGIVEDGKLDAISLSHYFGCWIETARVVTKELDSDGYLIRLPLSEYQIAPAFLEQVRMVHEIHGV